MSIWKDAPRLWGRFARDRSGVAAVEFAFVGLPFILILYAIIETGLILTGNFLLERGSEQVGRLVLTGQLQGQEKPPSKEEFKAMICDQIAPFLKCDRLKVDLRSYDEFSSMQLRADMAWGFPLRAWRRQLHQCSADLLRMAVGRSLLQESRVGDRWQSRAAVDLRLSQ